MIGAQSWIRLGRADSIIGNIPRLGKSKTTPKQTAFVVYSLYYLPAESHSEICLSTVVFQRLICFYVA
jgi:hypothetical protein